MRSHPNKLFLGMLAVGLVGFCYDTLIAAYPESGSTCVSTGGSSCQNLGGTQCNQQGGTGSCTYCAGGGSLPSVTCVIVQGGAGCSVGGYVYCGASYSGCCCAGQGCINLTSNGWCATVYECS